MAVRSTNARDRNNGLYWEKPNSHRRVTLATLATLASAFLTVAAAAARAATQNQTGRSR